MKILVINPGSTSTKVSVYEDKNEIFTDSVFHDAPVLLQYRHVNDQLDFRTDVVIEILNNHSISIESIDLISARGGSAFSQAGGIIEIDESLFNDTLNGTGGSEHAAKLGVMIAYRLHKKYNIRAFTLNATNVDELNDYARLTGIKGVYRNAQAHVLNQKAVLKYYCRKHNLKYEDNNFICIHVDGGITVGAHEKGKLIDCNVGSGGDGPFTPTRIGSVPVLTLLDYIDEYGTDCVRTMCSRSGGFVQYFGTSNGDTVMKLYRENDYKASLVVDSMIYNIAKEAGAMATVLKGNVKAIVITGGYIRYSELTDKLKSYIEYIAPVELVSDKEQETLALEAYEAFMGREEIHKYTGKAVFEGFDF
ncbi:MAG: butyrate kinase [Erysipelotrichaceae bacterium]